MQVSHVNARPDIPGIANPIRHKKHLSDLFTMHIDSIKKFIQAFPEIGARLAGEAH